MSRVLEDMREYVPIGLNDYFPLFLPDTNKSTKLQVWYMEQGLVDIKVLPWLKVLFKEDAHVS